MKNIYSLLIIFSLSTVTSFAQLTVDTYDPVQDAINVSKDINTFSLTFNQDIQFNSDDIYFIYIKRYGDDSQIARYLIIYGDADDELSISGSQFLISDATLTFDYDSTYYITIDANTIQSLGGAENYAG
ncbi:MAG: hypothetical protein GXO47_05820, partial [Chlorobi bacterium]|nr:hypothetical protein [Chlorobiota bacterium]